MYISPEPGESMTAQKCIPNELLISTLENVVALRANARYEWKDIEGFASASSELRTMVLKAWFRDYEIYGLDKWREIPESIAKHVQ